MRNYSFGFSEVRSTVTSQREGFWIKSQLGSLNVHPGHMWVLFGYSGFLLQSKELLVRLIGPSKLTVGVNVSKQAWFFVSVLAPG